MFYSKIRTSLMLIAIVLTGAIVTLSQETQPIVSAPDIPKTVRALSGENATIDECEKRLLKALDALDASDAQIASRDAQIANKQLIIDKQEARFVEVIKILQQYAELDNKKKKGFWASVGKKLAGFVDTLTDPATIKEILLVIALIKAGD